MTGTPTPGTPEPADPVLDSLNAALAGEHAAVYAYGVIGAHVTDAQRTRAATDLDRHRAARDRLTRFIRESGGTPSPSEPAYALPFPVEDAAAAANLADHIENRLAGLYTDVVTATDGPVRTHAATRLTHTAQARVVWSGMVTAFPGLDDRLTLDE